MTVPYATLQDGDPDAVGMDSAVLDSIDALMAEQVGPEPEDRFAGAVVLVARDGVVVATMNWSRPIA